MRATLNCLRARQAHLAGIWEPWTSACRVYGPQNIRQWVLHNDVFRKSRAEGNATHAYKNKNCLIARSWELFPFEGGTGNLLRRTLLLVPVESTKGLLYCWKNGSISSLVHPERLMVTRVHDMRVRLKNWVKGKAASTLFNGEIDNLGYTNLKRNLYPYGWVTAWCTSWVLIGRDKE